MTRIVFARSWREFKKQQCVAINSLYNAFPGYAADIHLCINNDDIDAECLSLIKSKISERKWRIFFYTEEQLDNYAIQNGAGEEMIEKFKIWKWIYHILLYHYLWTQKNISYLTTYDDDIFFSGPIGEVHYLINQETPFAMKDQYNDSDKALFGKLILCLGETVHNEYYACYSNNFSSNSGFMGILNEKIFSQFTTPERFKQMLDMFEYKVFSHHWKDLPWDRYKILLQEQSFLGILNRSYSNRTHIVLDEKANYSISDLENSKVQHYVADKKYSAEFLARVDQAFKSLQPIEESDSASNQ